MSVQENVREILGLSFDSDFDLSDKSIDLVAEHTQLPKEDILRVIGHDGGSLAKASGFSLVFILQTYLNGVRVLGSKSQSRDWMLTESIPLGNKPLEMLGNPIGVELVRNELGRIEFGVLA